MTPHELDRQIRSGKLLPVYYFHGEEDFLLDRALRALVDAALAGGERSFNHHVLWAGEHKPAAIVAAANEFPFMAERRVVVVRDADRMLDDETLDAYLRAPSRDAVVVLVASGTGDAKKRRKTAKKKGPSGLEYLQSASNAWGADCVVEFAPLKEAALAQWITTEAERHGKRFSDEALPLLISVKSGSTRELATDLEKLAMAVPEEDILLPDHIYLHLGISRQYNIYELTTRVFEQRRAEATDIAFHLLEETHATVLVASLARDCATLWQIDALQRARARVTEVEARQVGAGSMWRFNLLRKHLEKLPRPKYFEGCFHALLDADVELKSRPTDQRTVMARLIHQLTSPS